MKHSKIAITLTLLSQKTLYYLMQAMKKLDHPYWIKIENITGDSGEVFAKSMAMSSSRNRANELSQALAWSAPFSTISSLASWTKLAQVAKLDDEAPQQDAPKGAQKDKHAKKRN